MAGNIKSRKSGHLVNFGCYGTFANVSASAMAFSIAFDSFTVS